MGRISPEAKGRAVIRSDEDDVRRPRLRTSLSEAERERIAIFVAFGYRWCDLSWLALGKLHWHLRSRDGGAL